MYMVVMEVKDKKFGQLRVTLDSLYFFTEVIAPTSWKYETIIGEVVNSLVFTGSNLFSFPPFLCYSLGAWPLSPPSTLPSLSILSFIFSFENKTLICLGDGMERANKRLMRMRLVVIANGGEG